ncbi:MAG: pseudouridine-5'-phosphate glycosidase [Phycisphaerae bacterium]|nr:pseudouridine-5'-phosphate glycosidase [Gemmatimonadaceae bacterium]
MLRRSAAVQDAMQRGVPLVALESSVFAQGLLPPHNRNAADRMIGAIVARGAAPAITAVVRGVPTIGLEPPELERFLAREGVRKVSARDLSYAMLTEADGATTVAGTLALCSTGNLSVFATGGIGGVHRNAPYDESADLAELAHSQAIVVCAGAKSILDLPATIERLETLGVSVVGYRTNDLPGFFTTHTGIRLEHRVQSAAEIAELWRNHQLLGRPGCIVVMQPPPPEFALDAAVVEAATAAALDNAADNNIRGGAVTPFLLAEVERRTEGKSVTANLALLEANAILAAEIAVALAAMVAGS